jgi:ATP-dependent helicase/nuclease subunit B
MPATVFLFTGPVASGKTHALLTRYRAQAASGIGTALWLTPSERAGDALRPRLPGPGGAILCPQVLTFPDFARRIVRAAQPAARPLPELHQRLLLDDVLAELSRRGDLPYFEAVADSRGFADAIFGFLTELKGQGIAPAVFAETVRELADSEGRRLGDKAGPVARIFESYQKRLLERGLLDREATYARARELWLAGRPGTFAAVRTVLVDGFVDFTRPQLDLLQAVIGSVDQVWITVLTDRFGDDTRDELFGRPGATTTKLNEMLLGRTTIVQTDREPSFKPRPRPAGLAHLERSLFRPEAPTPIGDADGLRVVEAPGLLGEVRLIARAVKTLLLDGTAADDVIVTARDLGPYADLVHEVFGEYGVPADVEGTDPLIRNPAVAVLLKAARLADEGFPFAGTTALLRSTYFHPGWPEVETDPDIAVHCDLLLRLLGEPRGRETYLHAARLWATELPPGLEDEAAEESRRRRKHEMAKRCLPFLEKLFQAWDGMPERAGFAAYADWLRGFAADLGLAREAEKTDATAWAKFWAEVDGWAGQELQLHSRPPVHGRTEVLQLLGRLATASGLRRSPGGPGRVRVLPAEQARHLECEHLFLMGLGERSFPEMGGSGPLFDESERQAFRGAGLEVRSAADRLPDEMLLFYQLVTRPSQCLILSFPAVDEKGQDLLPSTFLVNAIECFGEKVVPVEKQRMLIEGFDRIQPLSPAEFRVRWAAGGGIPDFAGTAFLPADLFDHVRAAGNIYRTRFERDFSPYDGMLRAPGVLADVRERFGPEKVFSPTALENYVACPFRFFLDQVLKLEPLDDPTEEVEAARRGAAVHRALSRFHEKLKTENIPSSAEDLSERLVAELRRAVGEYAARVSSPAAKMLWRLEGRRLERAAERYGPHWDKFRKPWKGQTPAPQPHAFEVDFGLGGKPSATGPLVIRHESIEIRIGGRIDRIDVTEFEDGTLGFWVIDYKTGRSGYYSGAALAAMEKLQLTVYAMAVERLVVPDGRPLGLGYWLTETGPKAGLPKRPTDWLADANAWPRFREQLEEWIATVVGHIRGGVFPLKPRDEHCTDTCDFGQVCRIAQSRPVEKSWDLPLPMVAPADEGAADE